MTQVTYDGGGNHPIYMKMNETNTFPSLIIHDRAGPHRVCVGEPNRSMESIPIPNQVTLEQLIKHVDCVPLPFDNQIVQCSFSFNLTEVSQRALSKHYRQTSFYTTVGALILLITFLIILIAFYIFLCCFPQNGKTIELNDSLKNRPNKQQTIDQLKSTSNTKNSSRRALPSISNVRSLSKFRKSGKERKNLQSKIISNKT